jgi:hypothetical protein
MAKEIIRKKSMGAMAFLVGFILALVLGVLSYWLAGYQTAIVGLLVLIGVVVGFMNVSGKEVQEFLLAGAVLVIVAAMGKDVLNVIPMLVNLLNALLALFVPATLIVSIKAVHAIAKD